MDSEGKHSVHKRDGRRAAWVSWMRTVLSEGGVRGASPHSGHDSDLNSHASMQTLHGIIHWTRISHVLIRPVVHEQAREIPCFLPLVVVAHADQTPVQRDTR